VISTILHYAIDIYRYVVLAAIVASWVAPGSRHPIVVFLERVTEPLLAPLRKVIPPMGGFDLSPIVLLIALYALERLI
jgi:YggT family protein